MGKNEKNESQPDDSLDIALLTLSYNMSEGENDLDLPKMHKAVKLGIEYRDELIDLKAKLQAAWDAASVDMDSGKF